MNCFIWSVIFLVFVFNIFLTYGYAQESSESSFILKSTAFKNGGTIPREYTCDGKDISPELSWENVPANTVSFALICEDPDAPAGIWVHWVVYNIPVMVHQLPDNSGKKGEQKILESITQGINDFRKLGYGGPCPPPGKPHRYLFRLLALDIQLPAKSGLNRNQVLAAAKDHILGEAQLMGRYGR
jgi:hypothetical protein